MSSNKPRIVVCKRQVGVKHAYEHCIKTLHVKNRQDENENRISKDQHQYVQNPKGGVVQDQDFVV